jgi:hypothetical protein
VQIINFQNKPQILRQIGDSASNPQANRLKLAGIRLNQPASAGRAIYPRWRRKCAFGGECQHFI